MATAMDDKAASRRTALLTGIAGLGAAATSFAPSAQAQTPTESTFDRVIRTKTIRVAFRTGSQPFFTKDLARGGWTGALVELTNSLAKDLDCKVEIVEDATAVTSIIGLQTGRIDLTFGLSPSPQRALTIDFTASLFDHPFGIIARQGFTADTWAKLNDRDVRIAATIGTLEEQAVKSFAPNATLSGFQTRDDLLLATGSGRVDCGVFAALLGLTAAQRNPAAGTFHMISQPRVSLPSCAGVPKDKDGRWRELLNASLLFYKGIGQIELWLLKALEAEGVNRDAIPDGLFPA